MEGFLEYTSNGLLNRVMFLSSVNEINVFVEDREKEHEYQNIFERLFGKEIIACKIFAVGGKREVEKALNEYGDVYENKKNFYIVDGDFDLLLGKAMINRPNYIYLQRYNIESYFIDKNATLSFMAGKMKKIKEEADAEICFDNWREDAYAKLERLFLAYAVAQMHLPEESNVGITGYSYLDEQGLISVEKINSYEASLQKKIVDYHDKIDMCKIKYREALESDPARLICGKYILCCLIQYLRKKTGRRIKEDEFRYFVLSTFDVSSLDFIKQRIMSLV